MSSTYIEFNVKNNDKGPEFENSDNVRISTYNIFGKIYNPSWSEEAFVIKRVRNTVPCTYIKESLNNEEIFKTFYEK